MESGWSNEAEYLTVEIISSRVTDLKLRNVFRT